MQKLKQTLKRIFCPPPLFTVIAAMAGYGFLLAVSVLGVQNPVAAYASYLTSAYALIISITGLPYLKAAVKKIRQYIFHHPLSRKIQSTAIGKKFLTDIRFRMGISLYKGFFINLLYITMKMISGIYYRSTWLISLAVYYILLAIMRLMLVWRVHVQNKTSEWKRYRLCGLMLLLMNQALAGIVIFMVHQNKGFDYPGVLIYAMAFYAFYMVITATVNVVKTRRYNSPILSAARIINLVAALVSILSLETAMLARFGGDNDPLFRKAMTGATGGAVCTIVIGTAIFMIVRANKQL